MPLPARAVAAKTIQRVLAGQSLNQLLPGALDAAKPADRPLRQELIYGALREWPLLEAQCDALLDKPMRSKERDIKALICCGLHELSHLRTPAHAAVSECVNAARALKKPWATALVNRVLRDYQRHEGNPPATSDLATRHALPHWLWRHLVEEYGDAAAAIAEASRRRPPMTLRVNTGRVSRADYLTLLSDANIEAEACAFVPTGIRLQRGVDVQSLPQFEAGWVSVQDETAQATAGVLAPQPGEHILDACAAPGGKACLLAEQQPALAELIACDVSPERLRKVTDNIRRLGVSVRSETADARALPEHLRASGFDAILADVPCSATGVMRRNPDIKILRQHEDIAGFAEQQLAILRGLWPALKPGGRLLYVTCSILSAENDDVIQSFLARCEAQCETISLPMGLPRQFGWQCLPTVDGGDGLYFSLLKRPA